MIDRASTLPEAGHKQGCMLHLVIFPRVSVLNSGEHNTIRNRVRVRGQHLELLRL